MGGRVIGGLLASSGYITTGTIRNGVVPPGAAIRSATADYVNTLLGRRRRNQFGHAITTADTYGPLADTPTWRFQAPTSAANNIVKIRTTLIPTAAHGATTPGFYWKITNASSGAVLYDDGTSGTSSFVTYYGSKSGAPSTVVPDEFHHELQSFTLTAGTAFNFELHQQGNARVLAAHAWEPLVDGIDLSSFSAGVDNTPFAQNNVISDTPLVDVFNGADEAWEKLGAGHIGFTVHDTTAPRTVAGATHKNIIDTTTTWTATTAGFYIFPKYRHSDDTAAAGTNNAPVVIYCYAKVSAGTATVRFRTGSGASAYFGEINNISSTTGAWYATTANIDGANTSDKVDITAVASSGTVSVYAAGCYDWRD